MPRPRRGDPVHLLKGVERTGVLLHHFSAEHPTIDLPSASHRLLLPRSTAYRLLRSLEAAGLLVYDPQRRAYRLSMAMARLGQVALSTLDLRAVARPYLRRLVGETGESAFLLVPNGRSAIVVDVLESDAPLRLTLPVGTPWPLHAGASSRVLLAYLPEDVVEEYLRRPLERITPHTIANPRRLREELARTRRHGFAYSVGELTPDVAGVAVPILSGDQLMGSLTVAGPARRLTAARVPKVVARLQAAAREIAVVLEGRRTDGGGGD